MSVSKVFVFGLPLVVKYKALPAQAAAPAAAPTAAPAAASAPKKKPETTAEVTLLLKTSPAVQAFLRTNPAKDTLPAMSFQDYLNGLKKTMTPSQLADQASAKKALGVFWNQALTKLGGYLHSENMGVKGGGDMALYNLRLIAQHDAKYPNGAKLYGGFPPGIV